MKVALRGEGVRSFNGRNIDWSLNGTPLHVGAMNWSFRSFVATIKCRRTL
jgi:hypothetical protein